MATAAAQALAHVKLLVLLNDASLRVLAGREIKTGFGFLQSKPSTSFAPVAVTPDELGRRLARGRVHLPVRVAWNGRGVRPSRRWQMGFGFHELVAHAARTRNLHAGTIIGSGTISNDEYRTVGSACIAERRGIETVDQGKAATPYMKFGDAVRIEMLHARVTRFSAPSTSGSCGAFAVSPRDGPVVVVTGASRGLGRGCALAFATQAAEVVLIARKSAELEELVAEIRGQGGHARAVACDATRTSEIQGVFSTLERCDLLINNAGANRPQPFLEVAWLPSMSSWL